MNAVRPLIATFGLLACATSASAECAWVEWEVNAIMAAGRLETAWSISETWETKAQCQEATRLVIQGWKDKGLDVRDGALVIDDNMAGVRMRTVRGLKCYPDTVDPRGPKGK